MDRQQEPSGGSWVRSNRSDNCNTSDQKQVISGQITLNHQAVWVLCMLSELREQRLVAAFSHIPSTPQPEGKRG